MADDRIREAEIADLARRLAALVDVRLDVLRLPAAVLHAFEPSQIGTIVGTLMDACIPELPSLLRGRGPSDAGGITRHQGVVGEREGYPDYQHDTGKRLELKLLYKDPVGVKMKSPPTPREASARLTQCHLCREGRLARAVDHSVDASAALRQPPRYATLPPLFATHATEARES